MSLFRPCRTLLTAAAAAIALVVVAACGGKSTGVVGSPGTGAPGDPCDGEGSHVPAADGCNTCTCANGRLACTEVACASMDSGVDAACTPGDTRSAGDECNTCSCSAQSEWICTRSVCNLCKDGDTKQVDCNTCSCSGGAWACTERACLPTGICTDGQTMQQDCNNCMCSGGQWVCTGLACPPPMDSGAAKKSCGGHAGNACSSSEYCAYTEGLLCGAADASATCEARPLGCAKDLNPVCGCDGNDYSNACVAAAAGSGVLHAGNCP